MLETPVLTRNRIRLAYAVAVTADALQMVLGPLGWAFPDEVIDVAAMVLTVGAIGFHPLLLPTFVVEFIPLVVRRLRSSHARPSFLSMSIRVVSRAR